MLEWDQGLMNVDEVGAASLLIDRWVFEQMEPPWFFNMYNKVWDNNFPGEDIGFCTKCRELGIPIYIDTTISSPHCSDSFVTEETFRSFVAANQKDFRDA